MPDGTNVPGAVMVPRGCGERVQGGVYAECGLGPNGTPVEEFLIDPPVPVPPALPITAIGVQLIERDGVHHILDWVGSAHYPNVADFVEEVMHFGMSRRLPNNLEWGKITPASRHLLIHARAYVANCTEYAQWDCPQHKPAHAPAEVLREFTERVLSPDTDVFKVAPCTCCAGFWWRDIEGGEPDPNATTISDEVIRKMPSFEYFGHARPAGCEPKYAPAFFAAFPITRLVVVEGEDSESTLEELQTAGVPVAEVAR